MRGQIKLEVEGVIIAEDDFKSEGHRDLILRFWKKDIDLKDISYYLIIIPDEEEVALHYHTERIKGIYRGRFKPRHNKGTGGGSDGKEGIEVRQQKDDSGRLNLRFWKRSG